MTWMNLEDIMPSKPVTEWQKLWFHYYLKESDSETGSRMWFPGTGRRGRFGGRRASVVQDGEVLEIRAQQRACSNITSLWKMVKIVCFMCVFITLMKERNGCFCRSKPLPELCPSNPYHPGSGSIVHHPLSLCWHAYVRLCSEPLLLWHGLGLPWI